MSLWLCLRLARLPLEALLHRETGLADDEHAIAILQKQRVICMNDSAAAAGIKAGHGTATCRTLDESARLLERDPEAEQRALQQLCCWAYSITPTLYSEHDDCLLLEVGSCLALYRGLGPLLAQVEGGIRSRGYSAALGLAHTPKAAWLLSFSDDGVPDDPAGTDTIHLTQRLGPLPLTLLAGFTRTVDSLRRAGLHCFADILTLPPAALARRCGREFSHFLGQVLGTVDDRGRDFTPPARFSDEYWFGYEVRANQELLPAMQLLLQSLCQFLRNTQLQTGEAHWVLIGIDGKLRRLTLRTTQNHTRWEDWYRLTEIRLEQLQLETAIEGLALECEQLREGQLESIDLFSPNNQKEPLGSLLDRLRSRLGLQAIQHIGCRDEHLPEQALYIGGDTPTLPSALKNRAQRPFWLMTQPQPLRHSRNQLYWNGALELVYGPERIEDNWWREPVSRDYYIARGKTGEHYWVFRDRRAQHWFVHGLFA